MNIQKITRGEITVKILRDICIGAGPCIIEAPNTFGIDDEGLAFLKKGEWDDLESIILAAKYCPVIAIEVYKSGEKIYGN